MITTGIISSVDPATGIVTFKDGRMVKLTNQSKVLKAVETATVRPGEQVVVRNALPVGVPSTSKTSGSGKRQRMATVASVDAPNQLVRLTDGTSIRVTPSTLIRMGSAGQTMVLADLRPGDELVIVVAESGPTSTGTDATAASSALPRQTVSPMPADASEVMVFREIQAP